MGYKFARRGLASKIEIDGPITKIYMTGKTNDTFSIIDTEDLERVLEISDRWSLSTKGYAQCNYKKSNGKYTTIRMHRIIVGTHFDKYEPNKNQTDHINRNKLDNRKENLRICNNSVNRFNARIQKNNTSGIKGVHLMKNRSSKQWQAKIYIDGKRIHKYFDTKSAAIECRNNMGAQ